MTVQHEHLDLPGQVESVPIGRHFLQHTLRQWDLSELSDDVGLVASELLTNAVVHARSSVRLQLRRSDHLLVSVQDDVPGLLPPAQTADEQRDLWSEGGRGLALVAALSTAWGVRQTAPGKTVWFAVSLPATAAVPGHP